MNINADILKWTKNVSSTWDVLIELSYNKCIFNTSKWIDLLYEAYHFEPSLVILHRNNEVIGGVPIMKLKNNLSGLRIVSLPFSDKCDPMFKGEHEIKIIGEALRKYQVDNRVSKMELRSEYSDVADFQIFSAGYTHITRLTNNVEEVFQRFKKTQIQQRILKVKKESVLEIEKKTDQEALRTFYRLHLHTRRRIRAIPQPWKFFQLLGEKLLSKGYGFVELVKFNNTTIAAAIFLTAYNTITYKYSASLPIYWKYHPNHLMLWDAIQYGCKNGYKKFDWGRTNLMDEALRQFKLGWGSEEHIQNYTKSGTKVDLIERRIAFFRFIISRMLPILPLSFIRLTGKIFYNKLGY